MAVQGLLSLRFRKDVEGIHEYNDQLVVIDPEHGLADIVPVYEVNHERILAEGFAVPIGDAKAFTGRHGRIFVVNALHEATSDYRRIAELEKSTVLKQITRYSEKEVKQPVDAFKYFTIGIMALILIISLLSGGGN